MDLSSNECHIKFQGKLTYVWVDLKSTFCTDFQKSSISNQPFAQTSKKVRFQINLLHRPPKKSISNQPFAQTSKKVDFKSTFAPFILVVG